MAARPLWRALPDRTYAFPAVAFKDGGNVATAKEFVRFLVAEGWLMHYLDFSGERMLPSIPALLDQPFWLDPSDRHHMAAAIQAKTRPLTYNTVRPPAICGTTRSTMSTSGRRRSIGSSTEGISPEQAVDEAIARIKEILAE